MPDKATVDFLRQAGAKGGRNAAKRRSPETYRALAIKGLTARLRNHGYTEVEIARKLEDLERRRSEGFFAPRGTKPPRKTPVKPVVPLTSAQPVNSPAP